MSIFPQCLGCKKQSCKQQRSADTLKRPRQVTEICDRVAKEPREAALRSQCIRLERDMLKNERQVPEAVRLLAGAFAEKGGLPRRKLKAPELGKYSRCTALLCRMFVLKLSV